MRIGEAAGAAGVSAKTVRYYESIGLVPEPARTPSGYRDYPDEIVERLRFIRDAQAAGLTLAEIHSVLDMKDSGEQTCTHTLDLLRRHIDDIDAQMERLRSARAELAAYAARAEHLDPTACVDVNRCQVISGGAAAGGAGARRFGSPRRA